MIIVVDVPPYVRRLAGSSVHRCCSTGSAGSAYLTARAQECARTSHNRPISAFGGRCPRGSGYRRLNPKLMMVPTAVPSLCKISKISSRTAVLVTSEIALPGLGAGLASKPRTGLTYIPLAGWPFTAMMSPSIVATAKLVSASGGVTLGLVANFNGSEMSA